MKTKKSIALFLAAVLMVGTASGCGGKNENDDGKIEDETEEQENKEKLPNEEIESLNDDETQNVSEESKEKENNDEEN